MMSSQGNSNNIQGQRLGLTTRSLRPLRYVAIVGPIGFAVGVGLLTELVLERALPQPLAAAVATLIVATGAIIFASWIFRLLSRIQQQMAQMARLEERELIALKLHDDVIQSIYATQLNLQASLEQLQNPPQDARDSLNKVLEDLTDVTILVRRHLFDLRLGLEGPSDLARALRHQVEDVQLNSLINADIEIMGPLIDRLREDHANVLFLLTKEALANASRHSRANHIRVRLCGVGNNIQIEISDDGVGFDPRQQQSASRNGLRKMNEWAESVGGTLLLDTAEGRGTRVQLRFPIA